MLYSTNRFILSQRELGNTMFQRLCAEWPPQRLASVTALDLEWEVRELPGPQPFDMPLERPQAENQLPFRMLLSVFPGLKRLHVSLEGEMLIGSSDVDTHGDMSPALEAENDAVFVAADWFVKASAGLPLDSLFLSLTWRVWSLLLRKYRKTGRHSSIEEAGYPGRRFWKAVKGAAESRLQGYWLVCGSLPTYDIPFYGV